MGMSQEFSPYLQPTVGTPQHFIKARRVRPGRIASHASAHLNPNSTVAPRDTATEWANVQRAIAGNVDAHECLFTPHTGRLYRTAFAMLRNKEDAEDALQEGLCKAYTSLRSFQGRSSFSSWLTRIVINAALMARRSKRAHPESSLDEILDNQSDRLPHGMVEARPDPEKTYAAIEINALVEQHVHQLPTDLKEAYRLRAISGLSTAESCRALGIPGSAFKSRIFRARQKLAYGLQHRLGEPGA